MLVGKKKKEKNNQDPYAALYSILWTTTADVKSESLHFHRDIYCRSGARNRNHTYFQVSTVERRCKFVQTYSVFPAVKASD